MVFPQACTIAGSDSGGGAGIQADLKTFQERRVFGTSVIVAVTSQNTLGVQKIHPIPLEDVLAQLNSVFSDFSINAIKTGMLADTVYIREISKFLKKHASVPLVVDPVMVAKGGMRLIEDEALASIISDLIPIATLITPNLPEAESLLGVSIDSEKEMIQAAVALKKMGAKNVLIKGGHSSNTEFARDYLLTEYDEGIWLESPRIETKNTHGTGCTYSACITAELAKNHSLIDAVKLSKRFITSAIKHQLHIGHGHGPTNHWGFRDDE